MSNFIEENDSDYVSEAISFLEHLTECEAVKNEELDIIGELLSNMYGALEVEKLVRGGMSHKDALNTFMQRVMGSIDK